MVLRRVELRSSRMQSEHSTTELQPFVNCYKGFGKSHERQREYKGFADRLRDIILAETLKLRDPKI